MNPNVVVIAIYNLCLMAGTAWLVAVYDWSPWWFLLILGLLLNQAKTDDK
jgi:hypothetical protein